MRNACSVLVLMLCGSSAYAATDSTALCQDVTQLTVNIAQERDKGVSIDNSRQQWTAVKVASVNSAIPDSFTRQVIDTVYANPKVSPAVLGELMRESCVDTLRK